jgi:pimeloyl-ACP methyl ester carboxylesterase
MVREEIVTFHGPAGPLAGSLTLPARGHSRGTVLILPGSGAIDRDGNSKRLRMNIYRDLAQALTAQGFTTLRYDKRGVGRSPGDIYAVGFWDRVDDAEAAVRYLRSRNDGEREPVILLGHSEGCIIAPAVNRRQEVDGIIFLAGPCESLDDTTARQQAQAIADLERAPGFTGSVLRLFNVPQSQRRKSQAVMTRIRSTDQPWIRVSGVKLNAKWIREHLSHDVRDDLPAVRCPSLAITGTKDVQVLPEHARLIAETVSGPGEWHLVQDMTHLLRRTQEDQSILKLIKLYRRLGQEPIDAELLSRIAAWLDVHFPGSAHQAS